MIRSILALSVFFLSALAGMAAPGPNVIFFLVDDYDKPETSAYGGEVLTPNLDRLAAEGMIFHHAHVTSTVCTPSRYTSLTGRYAGASHSDEYEELFPRGAQGLPGFNMELEPDNMNVARVLAEAGYATGFVGKWHVSAELEGEALREAGLHEVPKKVEWSEEVERKFFENEKRYRELVKEKGFTWAKNVYWNNLKEPWKGHNPEWTIEAALEFVEEHKEGPFYLHYCTTLLHGPNGEWHRSLEEKELVSGEGMLEEPLNVMPRRASVMKRIRKAGLTENEAGYLWMDDSLGMLLDQLDELGIAENTIVLFMSDHGSNMKGSMFKDRGTEVPFLMRWPAGIAAGSVCDALVQNTDLAPTWFELAGAEVPKGYRMDGVSLAPLLGDPTAVVREFVYGEMGAARSVKTKEFNYISLRYTRDQVEGILAGQRGFAKSALGLSGGVARGVVWHEHALEADQLYHLGRDPGEETNLAGNPEYAGVLDEMKERLKAELERFEGRPYGEFVPGGNAAGLEKAEEALVVLQEEAKKAAK